MRFVVANMLQPSGKDHNDKKCRLRWTVERMRIDPHVGFATSLVNHVLPVTHKMINNIHMRMIPSTSAVCEGICEVAMCRVSYQPLLARIVLFRRL